MSHDEWMQTQDVAYHGTFREDYFRSPTLHMGKTIGTAANALAGSDYSMRAYPEANLSSQPEWDDENLTSTHIGRVYARRLTKPAREHNVMGVGGKIESSRFGDAAANAADVVYRNRTEDFEDIPGSLRTSGSGHFSVGNDEWGALAETTTPQAKQALNVLDQGAPIAYHNTIETWPRVDAHARGRSPEEYKWDDDAMADSETSYVVPKGAHTTWEEDVLAEPTAAPMAQRFAQQRMNNWTHGSVVFPSGEESLYDIPRQTQLFETRDISRADHVAKLKGGNLRSYGPPEMPTRERGVKTLQQYQFQVAWDGGKPKVSDPKNLGWRP